MIDGMAGNLMTLVERWQFARRDMVGKTELAGVEVKTAANAIAIEEIDQAAIVLAAVVVAHDQGLAFALGKTGVERWIQWLTSNRGGSWTIIGPMGLAM